MDYSSINNDPENPIDASPWASSPQHNRTTFGAGTTDIPSSPQPSTHGTYSESTEHEGGFTASDAGDSSRPATAGNGETGAVQQQQQQPPLPEARSPNPYQQQHQQPYAQDGQQARGARVDKPRPNVSQNKLQAKVTGLERTGRKDPMIKFDVYVYPLRSILYCAKLANNPRQIYQSSVQRNIETFDAPIPSFRSSQTILYLPTLKRLFLRFLLLLRPPVQVQMRMKRELKLLCNDG